MARISRILVSFACDSCIGVAVMTRETALKILNDVRQSYDTIAQDFSRTRRSVWEEFKPLADYAKTGDRVLDLGCGNGRLIELFKGRPIEYSGVDISENLIAIAKQRYPGQDFQVFDGLKTPFKDNWFDKIYCIAVLHHIPSYELRKEFLEEARRVLNSGGKLILTTWYLWNKLSFWRLLFKFTLKKLIGKSPLDFFDIMEPWGKISERYLHNFRKRELKRLIIKAGFQTERLEVLKRGESKNLLVAARK